MKIRGLGKLPDGGDWVWGKLGLVLVGKARLNKSLIQYSADGQADYSSDHELAIAKFRLKLKKIGKTTRLFRYFLNQIPYDYTVEVTNRFKGLDLIQGIRPEEQWTEVRDIVQEAVTKTILQKKKCKKAKWLSEATLQIPEGKKKQKQRRGKKRYTL